jgi:hypothetical protein
MFEKWRIKEHMEVADSTGQHVGTVDEIEDNRIKLTRSDASDGIHHYVDIDMVERIDDNRVYLKPGTPQPFLSGSGESAGLQGANAGGSAGATDLPGYENKLFGTSGTGMGGSGSGEH